MSIAFEAPALSPSHRYLKVLVLRLRRFVNRSVAETLASCERQAMRAMLKKLSDRDLKDIGLQRSPAGFRSTPFA